MGALCSCQQPLTKENSSNHDLSTPKLRSITDESIPDESGASEMFESDQTSEPMIKITDLSPNLLPVTADSTVIPDFTMLPASSTLDEDKIMSDSDMSIRNALGSELSAVKSGTESVSSDPDATTPKRTAKERRKKKSGRKKTMPVAIRYSPKLKVYLICRFIFRELFGLTDFNLRGHFVDYQMSPIIHLFYDSGIYPKGNLTLTAHSNWVRCSVISTNGIYVYTASLDNTIIRWDLSRTKMMNKWQMDDMEVVISLGYHSDLLAIGSYNGTVSVRNAYTYELKFYQDQIHGSEVNCVEFNPSGTVLISGSNDTTMRLWSIINGDCIGVFQHDFGNVTAVRFLNNEGTEFISSSNAGPIVVWSTLNSLGPVTKYDRSSVNASDLSFNVDKSMLASLVFGSSVIIWMWPVMTIKLRIEESVLCVCFHPSHYNVLAVGVRTKNEIRLFRIQDDDTVDCIHVFHGHTGFVNHLRFTPNGKRLVSASRDKSVRVWKIKLK